MTYKYYLNPVYNELSVILLPLFARGLFMFNGDGKNRKTDGEKN